MSKHSRNKANTETQGPAAKVLVASLVRNLYLVEEIRNEKGLRHPIVNVLAIAVLGCMCGCDDAERCKSHPDWK